MLMKLSDLGLSLEQTLSVNLVTGEHLRIMIEIDFAGSEVADVEIVVATGSAS